MRLVRAILARAPRVLRLKAGVKVGLGLLVSAREMCVVSETYLLLPWLLGLGTYLRRKSAGGIALCENGNDLETVEIAMY